MQPGVGGCNRPTSARRRSMPGRLWLADRQVDPRCTSEQKHRWVASALILIEPRLRRIKGPASCRCCVRPCRLRSGGRRSRRTSPGHERHIGAALEFQLKLGLTGSVSIHSVDNQPSPHLNQAGCVHPRSQHSALEDRAYSNYGIRRELPFQLHEK